MAEEQEEMTADLPDQGNLQVNVASAVNSFPIAGARVFVIEQGTGRTMEELTTDTSGQTETISLAAPPVEYSLAPSDIRPYSEYNLRIEAEGFEPVTVEGTEILSGTLSNQPVRMRPLQLGPGAADDVVIGEHTLYGDYPAKIAEEAVKPTDESGEIVLSRVVIPEIVVVHDGTPTSSAKDYYVTYTDYIKNVASSEIYSTWSRAAITANVLAIMSFTLNRVYTEWYRNKGYDFTITSSTAYDQKWIYGRNIFEEISDVVDEIFDSYLSLPNVKQPILTQYCDGKRVTCPGWLSQWGSEDLGSKGYSTIGILRNYYGQEIYINTAEQISGIPISWPGYDLDIGATGDKVRHMQEQLLVISEVYTAIPALVPDGFYGERTAESVKAFQGIFGLPKTGAVDFATWYKISQIYVGITKIAELP
jgi:peptidoglycan hydrolase-like protein with peptidoglycan-binding domain